MMRIKPSSSRASRAATLPRSVYDEFKVLMFRTAYKIHTGDTHDATVAFGRAISDSQDTRSKTELTGLWLWYRRFWLPRRYPKVLAAMRLCNKLSRKGD